ncbi:MAG: pyruvate, phosphate dikinase [Ruminococcaceae bacterium]|nr:pyruvate, phosphate dikinase [Oscillospiraceae bacterium]
MTKYVYMFTEGNAGMKNLLGGKGANLAEMTGLGLPVPRGFTITTEACIRYYEDNETIAPEIEKEIFDTLAKAEQVAGKIFGDPKDPYLVSVRSGARASMPGMMDTILNLGLNDEVVEGLAALTENPRFAYDSYRRFISMFADVVMEIPKSLFEAELEKVKHANNVVLDTDLTAENMREVAERYKAVYEAKKGEGFPQDPKTQLIESVKAVFRSWNNERAIIYRRMNDIPGSWGTAVNVQEMVYGNMGDTSGTGVAFTRNPATGERKLYGEFLMNAQGEDVVAGIRTPATIDHLRDIMPEIYQEFADIAEKLERHYKDMQDMEFTIERGKLFMLQTRSGKRTAAAALKVAVDLVEEGMISKREALMKIDPKQLDALLHPTFEPGAIKAATRIAKGLPASPGAAFGQVYFNAEDATAAEARGEKVILVRLETSPEDIQGMNAAEGILTGRGGMTSHAAVVARGMGKCCISGCSEIKINEEGKFFTTQAGERFDEGDFISLDGTSGIVYKGQIATIEAKLSGDFATIMSWADEVRSLKIRTNADTVRDAEKAIELGAEGIGLCRTEHMFFEADRIFAFRKMIIAQDEKARRAALAEILPIQKNDFIEIFKAMRGYPVTIRLLDPPLHEFLPNTKVETEELANAMGKDPVELTSFIKSLHETNPMLGHRGCRLAVSYPEIAEMQTRAIMEAAVELAREGMEVIPEIMIPLVCEVNELKFVKEIIVRTAEQVLAESKLTIPYQVGTMIEIPRACLTAEAIAREADFFSFGTNDLTQMTYGLSRDDAGQILDTYYKANIFEADPTAKLDLEGVGRLMRMGSEDGRRGRPGLKLGICGEHGGDPASITFCHSLGFNYVSCSPFRVPIARLAAAQAVVSDHAQEAAQA